MEIPLQKTINIFRPNREYLIDIRKGKYDLRHAAGCAKYTTV